MWHRIHNHVHTACMGCPYSPVKHKLYICLSSLLSSPPPLQENIYIYIFIIGDNWRGFIPTKLYQFKPWVMKGQPKLFPPKCSPVPWIFLMSRKEVFLLKMSEGTRLDNLPTPTCSVTRSLTHSFFCSSPLSSCLDALCIPSPGSLLLCHPGGPWQILLCPSWWKWLVKLMYISLVIKT